jgi:Pyridoxamine 5'-phosphate oxidase
MTMTQPGRLNALSRAESLRLLGGVSMGRLVFTHLALPAIRPVNHVLHDGQVIIRTYRGTAIATAVGANPGTVVAYEADLIDPDSHVGWSVIIVGRASRVTDPAEADRYRAQLRPWVAGGLDDVIAIQADMVDGFRLDPARPETASIATPPRPEAASIPTPPRPEAASIPTPPRPEAASTPTPPRPETASTPTPPRTPATPVPTAAPASTDPPTIAATS